MENKLGVLEEHFIEEKDVYKALPAAGHWRGIHLSFWTASSGKETSFLASTAEIGCTNNVVRFSRFCL